MRALLAAFLLVVGSGCATVDPNDPFAAWRDATPIDAAMDGVKDEVEIAYVCFDREGATLDARNANVVMHAASLMKVAVMVEVFRRIDAGTFSPEDEIPVVNRFVSVVDGSPYSVGAEDDSDPWVHTRVGKTARIDDLVERMIVRSSNLATNVLIEAVGAANVTASARSLGMDSSAFLRGVEDGKAFRAGINNTTTAGDMARLLFAIYTHRAASRMACDRMMGILGRQEFRDGIPRGSPPGALIANKTGSITKHAHDAAIVFPSNAPPYVLVVMTRGFTSASDAEAAIARLAAAISGTWGYPPKS
jgi:beta-lactamase class A